MKFNMVKKHIAAGDYKGEIIKPYDNGSHATIIIGINNDSSYYEVSMFIPTQLSPNSSFVKFMLDIGIEPDGDIDLNIFKGYKVIVTVTDNISNKDGKVYSVVKHIELDLDEYEPVGTNGENRG